MPRDGGSRGGARCPAANPAANLAAGVVCALAAGAVCALAAAATAQPVLNEVLYDPDGSDTGREFVELFHPGPSAWPLAGCRLEFANGAGAPRWELRWTGAADDSVPAGGTFLIADEGWEGEPSPQALARLALQNGPDALRLVRADGSADVLGYGTPLDPQLCETAPHPGARSGQSLGRRRDGRDTDDNAADWAALPDPTPGRVNTPARALRVDSFAAEPPSLPRAGLPVAIVLHVTNAGADGLPAGRVSLADSAGADTVDTWLDELAAGEGRTLRFDWLPVRDGRRRFRCVVPGDSCGGPLAAPAGGYQVGVTDLYLSELMAAPARGAGEWIEIGNAGPLPAALGDFRLRDEDGSWRTLPARTVAPGELVALAPDAADFAAWWRQAAGTAAGSPALCPVEQAVAQVMAVAGWPSLNNSPPAGRTFADRLLLADAQGVVVDHVTFGADGAAVPAARSLERAWPVPRGDPARNWGPCGAPGGATPGCANSLSLPEPAGGGLLAAPNPFTPGRGGVLHVFFTLGGREAGWEARVFDLWGRRVRELGGDALGEGPRDVIWDGRDDGGDLVGMGAYILVVRTRTGDGAWLEPRRRLIAVGEDGS